MEAGLLAEAREQDQRLRRLVPHEHVRELEVAVRDAGRVQRGEAREDLVDEDERRPLAWVGNRAVLSQCRPMAHGLRRSLKSTRIMSRPIHTNVA